MSRDVKIVSTLAIVGVLAFVAYKKFHRTYEPIIFQGQTFLHVELLQENDFVETHFYSLGGKPMSQALFSIQVVNLSPKVTKSMRDMVDRRLRGSMSVTPVEGSTDRLFGVMQNVAVYIYLMEYAYVIYTEPMVDGVEADYRARSASTFDAMEWIPADNL
jgi:hypothetical protein